MKNLFFAIMAVLLINMSYAGEVGEDMKGDCVSGVQSSRFQEDLGTTDASNSKEEVKEAATAK